MLTVIRLLSSVQSEMGLKITFLIECFATVFKWADIVFDPIVLLYVDVQSLNPTVRLIAPLDGTSVGLNILVRFHVILQVTFGHEVLLTTLHRTLKWSTILYRQVCMRFHISRVNLRGSSGGQTTNVVT